MVEIEIDEMLADDAGFSNFKPFDPSTIDNPNISSAVS